MLTPIKKQGDEHIYILLQFNIIDWMPACCVDIRGFVWMLISSETTGNYQRLPEITCGGALSIPRLLLRLGVGFRLSRYQAESQR
ncbi:unknown [Bacteroides sp. CAG:545]|nr:unknown [Bacteroides sp. CAG:545]